MSETGPAEVAGTPPTQLAPGVRRLTAPNPSMMTGPGTNTYLIGREQVAVIDPGPALEVHIDSIQAHAGAPVRWILVTHTHPDHSPAAALLAKVTGAQLLGLPPPTGRHQDQSFKPDRILGDLDCLETPEFRLDAIHTPGHASNHLCFHHLASGLLFTGDHIIDGSTVVIDPPDGNMGHYIGSLMRLRDMGFSGLAPGHGDIIEDPESIIDWLIDHRLKREAKVLKAVSQKPGLSSLELVPMVYQDIPPGLYDLAERSLLAHLIKLEQEGTVAKDRNGSYWLPASG